MDYLKTMVEIAGECKDMRTYVIIGLLQSIRDNCPIDSTTSEEMLKLAYIPIKRCLIKDTANSTKIDSKKHTKLQNE